MEYSKLGNSGAVVSALCLGTMTFGAEADEAASHAHHRRLRRGRRQLHRHRRRLQRRRVGDDHRPLARAHPTEAGQMVVATKGRFPMGAGAERPRHLAAAPGAGARRVAGAARGRADRSLPDARLGRADPARGDAALPRRRDRRRQDRLLRLLELPRLAGHQGGAAGRGRRLGAAGDAAAAVQSPGARHRARGRAGLPRRRHRAAALVAARRRLAHGQVPAATCRRPARPASARTPSAAWRPTRPRNAEERTWPVIDAVAGGRQARGREPGRGGAGLGRGAAGGDLGDPRARARRSSSPTISSPPI